MSTVVSESGRGNAAQVARERLGSKIVGVDAGLVVVPYDTVAHWASGTRAGTTRLIVRVHTADGTIGLGETICLWEFVQPVLARTVAPLAIGENAFDIERIIRKMEGAGYYHHKRALVAALCGLEMALWDIVGKKAGLPVHQLWGGAYRALIPLVAYLQSSDVDRVAAEAARAVEEGYGTLKVKIGMGERSDIEIVRAAREAAGPDVKLRADVNGAWTIGTAKRQLQRLERYELEYVEQPLPLEDLRGHGYLRRVSPVPIALDESAYTIQDVLSIVQHEAADFILIDPHQAGGLALTRKAAAIAEAAGIPVTLHSGGELGVSTAAYLHLAASIPNLSIAIDNMYDHQVDDIVTEPHCPEAGSMRVPSGPGLGVELDEEKVARYAVTEIQDTYLDASQPGWFPTKPQY